MRSISAYLSSTSNIAVTRLDFNAGAINILQDGADKLTLADMNQESANMLMLQTRQSLGTTSLTLASQLQQAILKLF